MKTNDFYGSMEIIIPKNPTLNGTFDFPVEVDIKNVQVTELEAMRLVADKLSKEFCTEGLIVKPSEQSELKVDREKRTITFGLDLFREKCLD